LSSQLDGPRRLAFTSMFPADRSGRKEKKAIPPLFKDFI
jgi:hypothetical protein